MNLIILQKKEFHTSYKYEHIEDHFFLSLNLPIPIKEVLLFM